MADSVFRTKSIDSLLADGLRPGNIRSNARSGRALVTLGIGAIIGAGSSSDRGGDRRPCRARRRPRVHRGRRGLRVRRTCGYAEFASMIPVAGSAYTDPYADDGGVDRLDHRHGISSSIRGRRGDGRDRVERYLLVPRLVGRRIPTKWSRSPFEIDGRRQGIMNIPAIIILGILSALVYSWDSCRRSSTRSSSS